MRLINVETLALEQFFDSDVPEYAILSHTWTRQETTLQDFYACADPASPLRQTPGYAKIKEACRLSKELGYMWCWVDTNCIDKTSSVELSEAINSMFRWYAESKVCIVFLEDYEHKDDKDIDITGCRWLTRGWCLQELIAPKSVLFYDRHWTQFATKAELSIQLSKFTGIDKALLDGYTELSDYPVACRMSWAAPRSTSRLEDQAYCLLGILGVNMPMLYGEGSKAFERLQQEVLRVQDDASVLLWATEEYLPLLAPEVSCFAKCGGIRLSGSPGQESQALLTSTSRGIHVRGANMRISSHGNVRCYVFPLPRLMAAQRDANGLWGSGNGLYLCIKLRKVGVGTYSWLGWAGYEDSALLDASGPEEEFYITDLRDILLGPMIQISNDDSLDFAGFETAIIAAEPRASWDSAYWVFYRNPLEEFFGYVRVALLNSDSASHYPQSFVLAVHVIPDHQAGLGTGMSVCVVPSAVWESHSIFHRSLESYVWHAMRHQEAIKVPVAGLANYAIGPFNLTVKVTDKERIDFVWSAKSPDS